MVSLAYGNVWAPVLAGVTHLMVVPTSGSISDDGQSLTMAFGIAAEAKAEYPGIAQALGKKTIDKSSLLPGNYTRFGFVWSKVQDGFAIGAIQVSDTDAETTLYHGVVLSALDEMGDMAKQWPEMRVDMPHPIPSFTEQLKWGKTIHDMIPDNVRLWIDADLNCLTTPEWKDISREEFAYFCDHIRSGGSIRYGTERFNTENWASWEINPLGAEDTYLPGFTFVSS